MTATAEQAFGEPLLQSRQQVQTLTKLRELVELTKVPV
jgi:hypothetical protein